jgi:RNA recognition motif-containing protein
VHSAHIARDHKTKKRKGIAFVKISKEGAEQAIAELNGSELYGRTIVVKIANERKKV